MRLSAERLLKIDAAIKLHNCLTAPRLSDSDLEYSNNLKIGDMLNKLGMNRNTFYSHLKRSKSS